jgi:predicted methyltransferase
MKKLLALIALSLSTLSLSATAQMADHNHALMMAIDNPQRSEANKARDVYRHPYETLTFFGVQPTHTVVEMFPGAGWYTEILTPYLSNGGTLIPARSAENLAPAGTVDVILDFRNAHNWMGGDPEGMVKAWHAALKAGGVVGLVDHRHDPDVPFVGGRGYIHRAAGHRPDGSQWLPSRSSLRDQCQSAGYQGSPGRRVESAAYAAGRQRSRSRQISRHR